MQSLFLQEIHHKTNYYSNNFEHAKITIPEGYKIIARLPEIPAYEPGIYDFEVEPYNNTPEGREMIYIANSSEPSEDDEIAEFYDTAGMEAKEVPQNKNITLSVWLKKR